MTSGKTLRTAVVGLEHGHQGKIGPNGGGYIETLKHLDGVEIVAYCEPNDPSLMEPAKEHEPEASLYASIDDLIANEEFDLAWLSLPARDIPLFGIKLAEAGKHFFIEKQYARKSEDLAELVRAVRKVGVRVMCGYIQGANPLVRDLKKMIDEGILGRLVDIESRMITGQVRPGLREPTSLMYTNEEEGGGILHMLACHNVALMRHLMDSEVRYAQGMTSRPMGFIDEPLEDIAIATFEYENGALGSLHAGYLQRVKGAYDNGMVVRGDLGEANWTPMTEQTLVVRSGADEWAGSPERTFDYTFTPGPPGYASTEWMIDFYQRFVDDVREDRESQVPIEVALHVLQTIDATYEAARTGQRVEVKYGV